MRFQPRRPGKLSTLVEGPLRQAGEVVAGWLLQLHRHLAAGDIQGFCKARLLAAGESRSLHCFQQIVLVFRGPAITNLLRPLHAAGDIRRHLRHASGDPQRSLVETERNPGLPHAIQMIRLEQQGADIARLQRQRLVHRRQGGLGLVQVHPGKGECKPGSSCRGAARNQLLQALFGLRGPAGTKRRQSLLQTRSHRVAHEQRARGRLRGRTTETGSSR